MKLYLCRRFQANNDDESDSLRLTYFFESEDACYRIGSHDIITVGDKVMLTAHIALYSKGEYFIPSAEAFKQLHKLPWQYILPGQFPKSLEQTAILVKKGQDIRWMSCNVEDNLLSNLPRQQANQQIFVSCEVDVYLDNPIIHFTAWWFKMLIAGFNQFLQIRNFLRR